MNYLRGGKASASPGRRSVAGYWQRRRDYRVYRYRVLVDGWEYSTGVVESEGRVAIPVTIDSFIDFWEFPEPIAQTVPVNQDISGSDWKAGNLYLDGGRLCISLRDTKKRYCYPTLLGRVVKEDLEPLKSLYPCRQRQEQAEIAMCLE